MAKSASENTSSQKKKREFLLAEPGRALCKECGATYHYPMGVVPLLEFVTNIFNFYEAHEHCGEVGTPVISCYPPLPVPSFVDAIEARYPEAKVARKRVKTRKTTK